MYDTRKKIKFMFLFYFFFFGSNRNCTKFLTSYSSILAPPKNEIFELCFDNEHVLPVARRIAEIKATFVPPPDLPEPKLFSFQNNHGDTLYGFVMSPAVVDPSKKFPTLLKVYGGPHAQVIPLLTFFFSLLNALFPTLACHKRLQVPTLPAVVPCGQDGLRRGHDRRQGVVQPWASV